MSMLFRHRYSAISRALAAALGVVTCTAAAPIPDNLVVEGVPPVPAELRDDVGRYLEFRAAMFQDWHPQRHEMLILTRFGNTNQLHQVATPGGARRQLTFLTEPVQGGGFRPKSGECVVFAQDTGGAENFQLFRHDFATGRVTLLTDGTSRNTGPAWSDDGRLLAFASNARNGIDADIWVLDPDQPEQRRLVCEVKGGAWTVKDWSPDGRSLLLAEFLSANDSHLWLADLATGRKQRLTPATETPVSRGLARFSRDGAEVFLTSDEGAECKRLGRMSLADRRFVPLTGDIPWEVETFDLSPDGATIAYTTNEDGASRLRFVRVDGGAAPPDPVLPAGVITGLKWSHDGTCVGFGMTSARSPADAFACETATGKVTRWTHSEAGGLDTSAFVEPELVRVKSFDGLSISGLLYQPDAARFPGPRPVLILIHGGPEGQSRPIFLARNNFFLDELGIALLYPNVRGSTGYGKTFLSLDDGFKREDSVKDIGAFLDLIATRPQLDAGRVGVMGGSYGGYMTLASLIHYGDRLRCGCDIVGISNFLTFLENTADYRRDVRRQEYGDESDPKMADFLRKISPTNHAAKINRPLFIVQGRNDPRVPVTEAEQMVRAVRANGTPVWYLMAKDEGHGFRKKPNADFQFLSTVMFFKEHL
ncbi:MAG: S9 family peptidase [Akkermansiaceae bacterium]|nr:S9 family peptidase [Akkermansiaceae bacterium]